jgi:hypothetical protein
MPYIGNPIYQSAFVTDQFSGNGSTTAYTMSVAPAGTTNVLVVVSGVVQDPSTYGVVGNTLNFTTAPPTGTGNISCRYLGVPVTGVTTTAYRTVTEFTATAGQTTFTPPSYTVGYINVYRNGVLLGSADYTASNGTTVVLATGATAGDLVTVESFLVSSVLNALPQSGGTLAGNLVVTGTETVNGQILLGTSSAIVGNEKLSLDSTASFPAVIRNTQIAGTYLWGNKTGAVNNLLFSGNSTYGYGAMGVVSATGLSGGDVFGLGYTNSGGAALTSALNWTSSGYVTMPNVPSFKAYMSSNSSTSNAPIPFNTAGGSFGAFNQGGYYNTSTYRFTAPVSGVYQFNVVCPIYNQSNGRYVALRVNGSYFNEIDNNGTNTVSWISYTIVVCLKLSVNDYVDVYYDGAGAGYVGEASQWASFSGHFVG